MTRGYTRETATSTIIQTQSPDTASWVHIESPSSEELAVIAHQYQLELGHLKDALDTYEMPRFEHEANADYIFLRFPVRNEVSISSFPLLIILTPRQVFSVSPVKTPCLDAVFSGARPCNPENQNRLLFTLCIEIVNYYHISVTATNKQVRSAIIHGEKVTHRDIASLIKNEMIMNDFLADLIPMNLVFQTLLNGKHLSLAPEDTDSAEDLSLLSLQTIELCKSNLKNMVNIRDAYSIMNTNSLNQKIKLLTAMTIVLAIPTMIAGLFGMNVRIPFADNAYAFVSIITLSAGVVALLWYFFTKKDWL